MEGNKLLLTANFIPLVAAQNWVMYHYHCHFAPELERADWRRAVLMPHIEALKQQHRFVFDGMALYMMHDLGQEVRGVACPQGSHSDRKTWKNGKAFSSQGKVRENHTKYWKIEINII